MYLNNWKFSKKKLSFEKTRKLTIISIFLCGNIHNIKYLKISSTNLKKNQNFIKQYNITEDRIYFNVQCITYSNEFNDAIQIKFSKFIGGFIQRIINYCGVKGESVVFGGCLCIYWRK